ncbi:hypothetical protein [Paenibacillus sp. FSL R10-2778]|uniref:hypothetical protein n=1 Tax=Paenibacillus sp. FSL R10-2778 TaxID=2954659 RepID=UPI00315823B4
MFTTAALSYFLLGFSVTIEGTSSRITKVIIFLFINKVSPWIALVLIIGLTVTVCWQRAKFFIRSLIHRDREGGRQRLAYILFTISMLYAVLISGYAMLLIQIVMAEINKNFSFGLHESREVIFHLYKVNKPIYHVILFVISVGYSLLLLLMRTFYRAIYFEKVSINITLKSGLMLEGKYIINHNLDNSILIADSFKRSDRSKMLIPKANIETITFNRVDYSFGEKRIKSKLEYKEIEMKNEFDQLVKQWRKDQIHKRSNF